MVRDLSIIHKTSGSEFKRSLLVDNPLKGRARLEEKKRRNMASKNKKFNVKHMGGNVDRKESEQVTKDYEVRKLLCALDDF